jgi:cytoskeletal protein CcmA (bactofilin family)
LGLELVAQAGGEREGAREADGVFEVKGVIEGGVGAEEGLVAGIEAMVKASRELLLVLGKGEAASVAREEIADEGAGAGPEGSAGQSRE